MLNDATGGSAFTSPSKIRILLTPIGDIDPEEFRKWCSHVSSFETIRLTDLPRNIGKNAAVLQPNSPSGFGLAPPPAPGSILQKTGEIHLSFVTSHDPAHNFLAPFNLHRQVLGVLGLASYDTLSDSARNNLDNAQAQLKELCPGALLHRVFAFDTGAARPETVDLSSIKDVGAAIAAAGAGTGPGSIPGRITVNTNRTPTPTDASASDIGTQMPQSPRTPVSPGGTRIGFGGKNSSDLVVFPAVRKDGRDVRFYLRTLLPAFVGAVLDSLHTLVTGLEGMPLETPRETLDGLGMTAAATASTLAPSAPSNTSHTLLPNGTLGIGSGSGLNLVSPSPAAAAPQRKTMVLLGSGPTGLGRIAKVKADYALLTGDLWTALSTYDRCLTNLGRDRAVAGGQDAVWYASGLEGWAVARVLVARMGGEVESKAPNLTIPMGTTKEKDKKEREKEATDNAHSKQPWADIAEALHLAVTIYSKCLAPPSFLLENAKSASNETPRDYTHPLIHASACISHARFLLAIWASEGWNGESFDQLMYGGTPPALANDFRPTKAKYMHFCESSGVQRHEIESAASEALTKSVAAIKPSMQIGILSSLASLFGCIGFVRREAYLLRQVQAVMVTLIAKTISQLPQGQRFVPSRHQDGTSASQSIPQNATSSLDEMVSMIANLDANSIGDTAESVLVLALQVCETLGIDLNLDVLRKIPRDHILCRASEWRKTTPGTPLLNGALRGLWKWSSPGSPATTTTTDVDTPTHEGDRYPAFGWPEQQLALLRDTNSVAELFQDHVSVAFFSALMLRQYHAYIPADEQELLIQSLRTVIEDAKENGAPELQLAYWGPLKPIKALEHVALPPTLVPAERSHSDLRPKTESTEAVKIPSVAGLDNPFFWNPVRSATAMAGKAVLIQDERSDFIIRIENPLAIHLDFTSIKLSTSGLTFAADEVQASIPPGVTQSIKLSGTPRATGRLLIRGCWLRLAGCAPQEFLVPQLDEATKKTEYTEALEIQERHVKTKRAGLDVRPSVLIGKAAAAPLDARDARRRTQLNTAKPQLECVVLPPQPRLRVAATSLRHGALYLLEGQETILRIQLTNPSTLPVDYARFEFQDDLTSATVSALSEGEYLPTAAYDAEWDVLRRPTFELLEPEGGTKAGAAEKVYAKGRRLHVAPDGGSTIVRVRVRGKLGAKRAQIHIEYGHVERAGRGLASGRDSVIANGDGPARNFHTRRLTLPVRLEVAPVLEYSPLRVLPLAAPDVAHRLKRFSLTGESGGDAADEGKELKSIDELLADAEKRCLVSFRVRNVHPRTVAVNLELGKAGESDTTFHLRKELAPHGIADFVFPYERQPPSDPTQEPDPIPSLDSTRQFVISRHKLPPEEERQARRRFWLTEAVYDRIQARWEVLPASPVTTLPSTTPLGPGKPIKLAGELRLRLKRKDANAANLEAMVSTADTLSSASNTNVA
ncbi:hypothetical protein OC845_003389 [Tilletia horrida]|nr:hypothetical protein OC845_003389 [Tilletia horrida]